MYPIGENGAAGSRRVCTSIIHGDSDQLLVYWQRARMSGRVCRLVCSPATVSLIVCLRGGRRGQTERVTTADTLPISRSGRANGEGLVTAPES